MNDYVYFKVITEGAQWTTIEIKHLDLGKVYKTKDQTVARDIPANRHLIHLLSHVELLVETKGDLDSVEELI